MVRVRRVTYDDNQGNERWVEGDASAWGDEGYSITFHGSDQTIRIPKQHILRDVEYNNVDKTILVWVVIVVLLIIFGVPFLQSLGGQNTGASNPSASIQYPSAVVTNSNINYNRNSETPHSTRNFQMGGFRYTAKGCGVAIIDGSVTYNGNTADPSTYGVYATLFTSGGDIVAKGQSITWPGFNPGQTRTVEFGFDQTGGPYSCKYGTSNVKRVDFVVYNTVSGAMQQFSFYT